jgi:hypothetical protein
MHGFSILTFGQGLITQNPQLQEIVSHTQFIGYDISNIVQSLNKNGIYQGIHLPSKQQQAILDFAYTSDCYGNLDPNLGFKYSEKGRVEAQLNTSFCVAQYYNTSLLCPTIRTLAQDPTLLTIATRYLGAKPVFTGSRLWWTFVVDHQQAYDSTKAITFFHYDLDDYACLRFFFYLTHVDTKDGPHVCISGSHLRKKLSHILAPVKRRYEQELLSYYGSDQMVMVCGELGFGFAEDTFCYHKATRPSGHDRLMLQLQFALYDYKLHNDHKDPAILKRVMEDEFCREN